MKFKLDQSCTISSFILQEAIEAQLRQRLDLQGAHRSYLELKARKMQAEKEEEEIFRQQMMAKFAEDDRIEQMNAQRRRMKQLGESNCQPLLLLMHVCVCGAN